MREKAARGLFWLLLDVGGGQALSFLVFLIAARILPPDDYGVFAIAGAFTAFSFAVFNGMAMSLVQRERIEHAHLNASFWCAIAIASVYFVALYAGAPGLARLFNSPSLEPVLRCMSVIPVVMAAISVPSAILSRRLEMSTFAIRTAIGYVASGAVTIILALRGWGVMALALGQVMQWFAFLVVVYSATEWRPTLGVSARACRELAAFSLHSGTAMVVFFATNKVDVLLVGMFLDTHALGYYVVAQRLIDVVSAVILRPVVALIGPVLSRMRGEPERFQRTTRAVIVGVHALWLPLVGGLGAVSPLAIPLMIGSHWGGAAPVVQAMSFIALTCVPTVLAGHVLSTAGRPDVQSGLSIVSMIVTVVALFFAAQADVVTVGWAQAGISAFMLPVNLYALHRYAGVPIKPMLNQGGRIAAAGIAMIAAIELAGICVQHAPAAWILAWQVTAGTAAYLACLEFVLMPRYVTQMFAFARLSLPGFRPAREAAAE